MRTGAWTSAEAAKTDDSGYNIFRGTFMAVLGVIVLAKGIQSFPSPHLLGFVDLASSLFLIGIGVSVAVTSAIDYAHSKKG
jgi:hypothetical protein